MKEWASITELQRSKRRCAPAQKLWFVGGGNSAGQAAVFLSNSSRHVHILIRGAHLADTMSKYLIRRIEESPNITLHTFTEVTSLRGDTHLEEQTWKNNQTGEMVTMPFRHLYLMTGASPKHHLAAWLCGARRQGIYPHRHRPYP